MKRILKILGLILFISIMTMFAVENVRDNPNNIRKNILRERKDVKSDDLVPEEGEKASYLIKYLWIIPVAVAEIETGEKEEYRNHKVYPLIARASVSNFISRFIKAEGVIKSYVDSSKLYTWQYEENAQAEGHSPSTKLIIYNQDTRIMEFEGIKRKIPENTHDPLSALFYLRWQDYEKNTDITMYINSNQENYPLITTLRDRKDDILITTSFIKSPKRHTKSEAKITTFMLDDSRRIPLLLKIRTKFGPLTVRLTGVED